MFNWQERTWTCGPAALKMALEEIGISKTEKYLSKILNTTPKSGTRNKNLIKAAKYFHLDFITSKNSNISTIKRFMRENYKVIVCYFSSVNESGHYALVKNISGDRIFLADPSLGPKLSYSKNYFNKIWHGKQDKEKRWFIAIKQRNNRIL